MCFFQLEDNCFTVLCSFLPYISVSQPQAHTRPLPRNRPPTPTPCFSGSSQSTRLSSGAIQQLPTSCSHRVVWMFQCNSPFILPSPPTVSTSLFLTSEPLFLPKFYYHHQELGLLNTLVRNFLLERQKIDILLYQKLAENLAYNLRELLGLRALRKMQINSHLMNIILYSIF